MKKKIAITFLVLVCAAGFLWTITTGKRSLTTSTYSQFLEQVRSGQVANVIITGSNSGAAEATFRLKDAYAARTVLPSDYNSALVAMQDQRVNIEIRDVSSEPLHLLLNAAPFLLLLGVWAVLMLSGKFPKNPRQSLWG